MDDTALATGNTSRCQMRSAFLAMLAMEHGHATSEETTDALAALAPGTQQEDWVNVHGSAVVPEWFGLYAGLEATASRIRAFEPQLVHGLLQTEDYARAVISADPMLAAELIDRRVQFRMARQRATADLTIILGEGALALAVGPADLMAKQLDRPRSSAADVRVLPFSAGPSPRRSTFALLKLTAVEDPNVVYLEGAGLARYLDKPHEWSDYESAWAILMNKSVPIKEWP